MFKLTSLLTLASAASICPKTNNLCISSSFPDSGTTTCFRIVSSALGWVSLGVGSEIMKGADIYITWLNSSSLPQVFRLKGAGHFKPVQNSILQHQVVQKKENVSQNIPSWANLDVSFCRPTHVSSGGSHSIEKDSRYIYAYSDVAPTRDIDYPSANFKFHKVWGAFSFDFTTAQPSVPVILPAPALSFESIAAIHGVLMWIAWIVCPLVGIFIARYCKNYLGHKWYLLHLGIMGILTGLLSTGAFLLIFSAMKAPHFSRSSLLENSHIKFGLVIFILMFVQIGLGFLSNYLFDEKRTAVPIQDRLHWVLGRLLTLGGIINVTMGLILFRTKGFNLPIVFDVVHYSVLLLGGFGFMYGEIFLGQSHHKEVEDGEQEPLL
jgi:hypothetical protein